MPKDIDFDKEFEEILPVIEIYKPLYDWFVSNRSLIIYTLGLSKEELNNRPAYMQAIRGMAVTGLMWLKDPKSEFSPKTPDFRIISAVIGMHFIYKNYESAIQKELDGIMKMGQESVHTQQKIKEIAIEPYKAVNRG